MATSPAGRKQWAPIFGLLLATPLLWLMVDCSFDSEQETPLESEQIAVAGAGSDTLWREDLVLRIRQHASPDDSGWVGTYNALLLETILAHVSRDAALNTHQTAFLDQIARESRIRVWLEHRYSEDDAITLHTVRQSMEHALTLRVVDAWAVFDSTSASLVAGLAHSGSPFFRAGAFKEKRNKAKYFEDVALRWGEAAPELEAAMAGKDIGATIGPVFANGGWWVLRIKAIEPVRKTSLPLFEAWAPWVEGMLVGRKLSKHYHTLLQDRLDAHSLSVDDAAWEHLLDVLDDALPPRPDRPTPARSFVSAPPRWAQDGLNDRWPGAELDRPLLGVINGPQEFSWTVGQALDRMAVSFCPPTRPHQPDSFAVRTRRCLTAAIGTELLDRYARQAEFGDHQQVAHDSLLWARAIRARQELFDHAEQVAREKRISLRELLHADDERVAPLRAWAVSTGERAGLWFTLAPLDTLALDPPPTTLLDPVFLTRPASPPPIPYAWARTLPWALRW